MLNIGQPLNLSISHQKKEFLLCSSNLSYHGGLSKNFMLVLKIAFVPPLFFRGNISIDWRYDEIPNVDVPKNICPRRN